jgi:lysophospholipase L1-like esterase
MKMNRYSVGAALASAAVLALSACSAGTSSNPQAARTAAQAANAGNFTSVYFLGDSLTAGFQSDSLIDTSQPHGWANLVATQLGFPIALPLIASPGAPNQITLVHLSPLTLGTLTGTTTGRDNFALQPTDVAVPGALTNDVLNTVPLLSPATGQQQLNQLVLGYPGFGYGVTYSQAQQAAAANPTTIFLWIGNNDTLVADETGTPSSMTPLATFTTQYQQLVQYLLENTNAHLVIANIPDVTAVPYLTPASEVLAVTSAETGVPVANLSAVLGIAAGDLVNPTGTAEIPLILAGQQAGPITDSGFLSPTEIAAVQAQVKAFNQVISQEATLAGATLVDVNALFAQVTANGINENGYPGTTSFLGGMFSLDGIHPTNTGYAILANTFISAINSDLKKTYPATNVSAIAAKDPLYPPYPGHHFVKGEAMQAKGYPEFPAAALQSMKEIFGPRN